MAKISPKKITETKLPELQINKFNGLARIITPGGVIGHWTNYEHPIIATESNGTQYMALSEYYEGELKAHVIHVLVPVAGKHTYKDFGSLKKVKI
jgi:hypothetical protein